MKPYKSIMPNILLFYCITKTVNSSTTVGNHCPTKMTMVHKAKNEKCTNILEENVKFNLDEKDKGFKEEDKNNEKALDLHQISANEQNELKSKLYHYMCELNQQITKVISEKEVISRHKHNYYQQIYDLIIEFSYPFHENLDNHKYCMKIEAIHKLIELLTNLLATDKLLFETSLKTIDKLEVVLTRHARSIRDNAHLHARCNYVLLMSSNLIVQHYIVFMIYHFIYEDYLSIENLLNKENKIPNLTSSILVVEYAFDTIKRTRDLLNKMQDICGFSKMLH